MGDDENNIPRRLRRFYRKGEPIPPDYQPQEEKPHGEEVLDNEPWMNAHQASRPNPPSEPRRHGRERNNPQQNPSVQPPRFEKVLEQTQKPAETHIDHALGLTGKSTLEERLPQKSEQAIQDQTGKQAEIEHTLQELKELAALGNAKDSKQGPASFHFTPVGGAPTPVSPVEKMTGENPNPTPLSKLSPRERMEMRRQGKGMPPEEGTENTPSSTPVKGNAPPENPNQGSAHYRRRMGQLTQEGDTPESGPSPTSAESSPSQGNEDLGDFKDLFSDSKKKKKGTKSSEDDDLSLDEDMPLFDDEK